jgi:hypothetical protein
MQRILVIDDDPMQMAQEAGDLDDPVEAIAASVGDRRSRTLQNSNFVVQ